MAAALAVVTLAAALAAAGCRTNRDATAEGGGAAPAGGPVRLAIDAPRMNDTLSGPDVEVRFTLENYEVGYDSATKKGQHIHFILDNEPYVPHYSTAPYVLRGLPPGTHTVRAFPSRAWHESIKDPEAFAMVTFHVQRADGRNAPDPTQPLLTYSRPKGEYLGHDADSILVDFWLKNCELGPGKYEVRLTVDGSAEKIQTWQPLWKTGLTAGPHTFTLDLLAPDGSVAAGPFNSTERRIVLKPGVGADTAATVHH